MTASDRYCLLLRAVQTPPVYYRACLQVQLARARKRGGTETPILSEEIWVGINLHELRWWQSLSQSSLLEWLGRAPVVYPWLTIRDDLVCWRNGDEGSLLLPLSRRALLQFGETLCRELGALCSHNPLGTVGIRTGEWCDLRHYQTDEVYLHSISETRWLRPESRWRACGMRLHIRAEGLDLSSLPAVCHHLSLSVPMVSGEWKTSCQMLTLCGAIHHERDQPAFTTAGLSSVAVLQISGDVVETLPAQWWPGLRQLRMSVRDLDGYLKVMSRIHPDCVLDHLKIRIPPDHRGVVTIPEGVYHLETETNHLHVGPDVRTITYHCRTDLAEVPTTVRRVNLPARWCYHLSAGHRDPQLDVGLVYGSSERRPGCESVMASLGYRPVAQEESTVIYRYLERVEAL